MAAAADRYRWLTLIALVDSGISNLRSVENALRRIGCAFRLVAHPDALGDAAGVILPGVGAFGDGMRRLHERGLDEALVDRAAAGTPMLGICLGMQMLATVSYEFGEHAGLDLIPGEVRRIEAPPPLRVPHMGWNEVVPVGDGLLSGLREPTFYFIHSYAVHASDEHVTGVTEHGVPVTAAFERGAVAGVQFHPEKSHSDGLHVLRAFALRCGSVPAA